MYEPKGHPLLPARLFVFRMLAHLFWAMAMIAVVVLVGVAAHLWFEDISWHDAVLNTGLIVGGIGPFILPTTVAGKVFFSLYSMLVGLLFVGTLGLILAPLAHRLIHKFHLDEDRD
ncbi:two pore domain potassium channel family protein [Achromobacter denitrificans]